MKKIFCALMVGLLTITSVNTAMADGYYNGKSVQHKFPRDIEASRTYTMASYKYRDLAYDDTLNVSVTDLETYVNCDSMTGNTYAIITVSDYVYAGAKLFLRFANNDTIRTVYVKKGSTVIDTVMVADKNTCRTYLYNGTSFIKFNSYVFPNYVGTVTQATNISTAVTINADAGEITTVSSTLAIDSNASFTVNNSFVKSGSIILLTPLYAGNGSPIPSISSQTDGSFVLKLKNLGNAALNAVIKLKFLVLNR